MDRKDLLIKITISLFVLVCASMMWQLYGMDDRRIRKILIDDIYAEYLVLKAKPALTDQEQAVLALHISFLNSHKRFEEEPQSPKATKRSFLSKRGSFSRNKK